ncbi:MAG: single-stranded-DNA-specific exonuclease RecJ [Firmicutes bacterium]|nr:single-stranded-DNA-specific exonuclease RecJ [Bacillota bacterium]
MIFRKKHNLSEAERDEVKSLAKVAGFGHDKMTEILYCRGLRTADQIKDFLTPDIRKMYDPFLFKGMRTAVERITEAIEGGERIAIYGDYDVDGICATAILTLYLVERGVQVYPFIPNRVADGYGLNIESLEGIIERGDVSLLITCDCGISGIDEIAHCMDLGVDVIVTDHHEVGERLPECIAVVDAKQDDCGYPFRELCGASVALKLVEALGGRQVAEKYLYLASLATIADLVPLVDENRLIVQLGLRQLKSRPNRGLAQLMDKLKMDSSVTAGDIAYKISPHINAAGRMGDAGRAFELITDADPIRAEQLIDEILRDNTQRREVCESMYQEAVALIRDKGLAKQPSIIINNPSWERGITGIVSARLANEFCRPAFLLVDQGDGLLKGTARSYAGINLHELLGQVADTLEEFGGHSQAAGFSLKADKAEDFTKGINKALANRDDLYLPVFEYDIEVAAGELTLDFAKALSALEPFGNSNPRPQLLVREYGVTAQVQGTHCAVTLSGNVKGMIFSHAKFAENLCGKKQKTFLAELSVNQYNGKEYPRIVLKEAWVSQLEPDGAKVRAGWLYSQIANYNVQIANNVQIKPIAFDKIGDIIKDRKMGVLVICGNTETYSRFAEVYGKRILLHEFLHARSNNNITKVMVSPVFDFDLSGYEDIILLDKPLTDAYYEFVKNHTSGNIWVTNDAPLYKGAKLNREIMGAVYKEACKMQSGTSVLDHYTTIIAPPFSLEQWTAGLAVLGELGVVNINLPYALTINKGIKADLEKSKIYVALK